jgi:acetylornithine deacetylase/succinyl-diaminopimelate desuccinylase-like protein
MACPLLAAAQTNPAARAARSWRQQHEHAIVDELIGLLRIPNVARDRDGIQRNAEAIAAMMARRGIASRLVSEPGGNPIVFGEIAPPGATRTIVFYAHYDGQPVDSAAWATPPFQPVLRNRALDQGGNIIELPASGAPFDPESRVYARSASDDKAPIVALMAALDAVRAAGIPLRSRIKFVFEGEEEAGSAHLEQTLAANRELFAGDVWLMCDGPVHPTGRQSIAFGARGITSVDLTVYGPRVELHSGHYGNWAPNPALMLSRLLASMKDDHDRVRIPGFYDGVEPLGPAEKRAIAEAPDIDPMLMKEYWLGTTESSPKELAELIAQPSLNIRGMASAKIGDQAANVIPASATAALDIRLVKGMDNERTVARLIEHVRRQGYFVVDSEPPREVRLAHSRVAKITVRSGGYNAVRTPMDLPIAEEVTRVVESVRGAAVKVPTMGGGLPLASIERPLGTHTLVIPTVNHDNNQHSHDENLRIQNLWDGIDLMAALLTM